MLVLAPSSRTLLLARRCLDQRNTFSASSPRPPRCPRSYSPPPSTSSPPPLPTRTKHPELHQLAPSAYRLTFRSLPYSCPPSVLFPQSPLHTHWTGYAFTLRAFPSPSSPHASPSPRDLFTSSLRHLPSPPPSLATATSPSGLPLTAAQHHLALSNSRHRHKPYTLDLTILVSKKKTHKNAVIRERIKRRVREAVRLVVARGASADDVARGAEEEEGGGRKLVLRERKDAGAGETGPRKWLMPGYHYIASISSLEAYRMPLADLVEEVRQGLGEIKRKASTSLLSHQLSKLDLSAPSPSSSPSPSAVSPTSSPCLSTVVATAPTLSSHRDASAPASPLAATALEARRRAAEEDEEREGGPDRVLRRGKQVGWEEVLEVEV